MREFKVKDKVKWYEFGDKPLWDFDRPNFVSGPGKWVDGVVTSATDAVFDVCGCSGVLRWPQPAHCRSMYGEPGYLELVEAVPEPQFSIRTVEGLDRLRIFYKDACKPETGFPEYCRPELEAICKKMNDGGGEK